MPEACEVHVTASGDVKMPPVALTATKTLPAPPKSRALTVAEPMVPAPAVQVTPLIEVA